MRRPDRLYSRRVQAPRRLDLNGRAAAAFHVLQGEEGTEVDMPPVEVVRVVLVLSAEPVELRTGREQTSRGEPIARRLEPEQGAQDRAAGREPTGIAGVERPGRGDIEVV